MKLPLSDKFLGQVNPRFIERARRYVALPKADNDSFVDIDLIDDTGHSRIKQSTDFERDENGSVIWQVYVENQISPDPEDLGLCLIPGEFTEAEAKAIVRRENAALGLEDDSHDWSGVTRLITHCP